METREIVVTVAPSVAEVPMVEPEIVRQLKALKAKGWGAKAIAKRLQLARNTVRRYLRGGDAALVQRRPKARRLSVSEVAEAVSLLDGVAEGNAVVVAEELAKRGVMASVRTVQRAVEEHRREKRAAELATVRFETAPGHQMQVDFGEKWVTIAGQRTKVHLLAAVLGYSRRIFVRAFLSERQDDWLEGIAAAFRHFGGIPHSVLGDNARALVLRRDPDTGEVYFHPVYKQFCRDWDVTPRACRPYRARTKGKIESGVKYVKRNALAGRSFATFADLEAHLVAWCARVDGRVHKTTKEVPAVRFENERGALRALPERRIPVRHRRLKRRVSNDWLVNVDSVRYSVPHRLVGASVDVRVGDSEVTIFHGTDEVAKHTRCLEPNAVVRDNRHGDGIWRRKVAVFPTATTPASYGRSLGEYADAIGGGR